MTDTPATAAAEPDREPGALDDLIERFADPRVRALLFAGLGGLAMVERAPTRGNRLRSATSRMAAWGMARRCELGVADLPRRD